jgi:hypothetical protein
MEKRSHGGKAGLAFDLDRKGTGLLNLLILRHRFRRQGLRAETPVLASALRAAAQVA